MTDNKKATYEDAQLVLRLYELRREEKLREARDWFFAKFFPDKIEDIIEVLSPGHPHNAHFRMVVSYWDMAASFAVHGALDGDLLLESGGELIGAWAKIEKFIPELRERLGLAEYLRNIEEIINQVGWAPKRLDWIKERLARTQASRSESESSPG